MSPFFNYFVVVEKLDFQFGNFLMAHLPSPLFISVKITKLRQLGLPNRIATSNSNLDSNFQGLNLSNSKFDIKSRFQLHYSVEIGLKLTNFWLENNCCWSIYDGFLTFLIEMPIKRSKMTLIMAIKRSKMVKINWKCQNQSKKSLDFDNLKSASAY